MKTVNKTSFLTQLLFQSPLLLSIAALVLSFLSFQLTAVRSVKPVLVITYRGQTGWYVKNIGNGPALNIIVAKKGQADWFEPVRIQPLGTGEEVSLQWLGETNVRTLGATYADIDKRPYTSTTTEDLTTFSSGDHFPKWREQEIEKKWQIEGN